MKNLFTRFFWIPLLLLTNNLDAAGQSGRQNEILYKKHFRSVPLRAMDSAPSTYRVSAQELAGLKKDSANLYTGIRLLKENKAKEALPFLQKASENMQHKVLNVSEWYLALAYLKLGKTAEAEYQFFKIAETEIHPYQDEAEVVYQQLVKK